MAALYLSTDSTVTTADTLIATSAIGGLNDGEMEFRTCLRFAGRHLSPGTYYLGAVADTAGEVSESDEFNNISTVIAIMLGNAATIRSTATWQDTMFGWRQRHDQRPGADLLIGGAGADLFVVDSIAVANSQSDVSFDRIADYYLSAARLISTRATISISATSCPRPCASQPLSSLVRAFHSGTGTTLQIDIDGTAIGMNYKPSRCSRAYTSSTT